MAHGSDFEGLEPVELLFGDVLGEGLGGGGEGGEDGGAVVVDEEEVGDAAAELAPHDACELGAGGDGAAFADLAEGEAEILARIGRRIGGARSVGCVTGWVAASSRRRASRSAMTET